MTSNGRQSSPYRRYQRVYAVPLFLEEMGLGKLIVEKLGIQAAQPDLTEWRQMVDSLQETKATVNIALVGKYVELKDAYYSVREALQHAALFNKGN